MNNILKEISSASQEQEIGIKQINEATAQLEVITQSTANNANETMSSVENLTKLANEMEDISQQLKLIVKGS